MVGSLFLIEQNRSCCDVKWPNHLLVFLFSLKYLMMILLSGIFIFIERMTFFLVTSFCPPHGCNQIVRTFEKLKTSSAWTHLLFHYFIIIFLSFEAEKPNERSNGWRPCKTNFNVNNLLSKLEQGSVSWLAHNISP